jgi:hypothetical protein
VLHLELGAQVIKKEESNSAENHVDSSKTDANAQTRRISFFRRAFVDSSRCKEGGAEECKDVDSRKLSAVRRQ